MTDPTQSPIDQTLIRAARRILQPLVRILVRNGITALAFQELARKVFVDVTFDEFGIEGKPQTLARVSVITGLNRKEVARLRKLPPLDETDGAWWNRAGTVLAAWFTDDAFLDGKHDPLDLPFSGESPSFTELVKKHSGDMYPRAIADELLRLGAIEEVRGRLRMSKRGYVPTEDPARMIDILGLDTRELIETIDHNLQAEPSDKLVQRKVLANNLPTRHLAEFNRYSERLIQHLIEELARWLSERDAGRDHSQSESRHSAGIGVFQINRLSSPGAANPSEESQ